MLLIVAQALVILILIGVVYLIISDLFHVMVFNLDACSAASELCVLVQVWTDEYVPYLIISTRPIFVYHDFWLLVLLPLSIEIVFSYR